MQSIADYWAIIYYNEYKSVYWTVNSFIAIILFFNRVQDNVI